MANWRTTIKTFFADMVNTAIPEIEYFGAWNSQQQNSDVEETRPELGIFFEYSLIGDGMEYLLQRDMQQSERVPIEVTLHIMFHTYNEQSQDLAYEYADKITCEVVGAKHDLIHGRILKTGESEDINHRAAYNYQVQFGFHIKEAIFNDVLLEDANPETVVDPNPDTGRKIKVVLTPNIDVP